MKKIEKCVKKSSLSLAKQNIMSADKADCHICIHHQSSSCWESIHFNVLMFLNFTTNHSSIILYLILEMFLGLFCWLSLNLISYFSFSWQELIFFIHHFKILTRSEYSLSGTDMPPSFWYFFVSLVLSYTWTGIWMSLGSVMKSNSNSPKTVL